MTDFHFLPTAILENEHLRLEYLTGGGPRILGLSYHGSPNLLADVFDLTTDTPCGKFHFLGGHRLWTSPEALETTYLPDDSGLEVTPVPNGVKLDWRSDAAAWVAKSVQIELDPARPAVRLVHTITNEDTRWISAAPWAITMFKQGGTVLLPQPVGSADPHGLLANRLLALWPYTRLNDPRLVLRDDFILLHAASSLPPVKVGYACKAGWMAYWRERILFRKSFDVHPGAVYPDGGCSAETYCGDRFVELESLGPLVALAPRMSAVLAETWELYDGLEVLNLPDEIKALLQK